MLTVSWNCRGLGNSTKPEAVKDFLKIETPDILMLQETKIEWVTLLDLSHTKWKLNVGKVVSARSSFGGLATVWSEDMFELVSYFETQHWILTELCNELNKSSITLFNIYIPVHLIEKKECWHTLYDFIESTSPSNIIIVRDLNLVFNSKEKRGGNTCCDQLMPYIEGLIQQWDLIDFKPKKGLYRWTNNRTSATRISSCLVRFLVHSTFLWIIN